MPSEPKPGTPLPWGVSFDRLTDHDWLQIEQASRGCISGSLYEWPHLMSAIDKAGCSRKIGACMASVVTLCQMLIANRELAELQKPCVWTRHDKFACHSTSCGNGCGPIGRGLIRKPFEFCPFCGHPIQEVTEE